MDATAPPTIREALEVTCRNCSLTSLCLPRGLTADETAQVAAAVGRRKPLQRGEWLYRAGDPFRGILAIKAGTVKTVAVDDQGREHITGLFLPGELLGFDALATGRHQCTAVALETLGYCELPATELDTLCQQVPGLLRELFRHAGGRLNTETAHSILARQPAEERVASLLLDLSERLERRGFSAFNLRLGLTRQEIGNYLGLAPETVSRILHGLQAEGLITVNSKQVRIVDRGRLASLDAGRD